MARTKGARNKRTIERERIARAEAIAAEHGLDLNAMEKARLRKPLPKDDLVMLADMAKSQLALYQNHGWEFVTQADPAAPGGVKTVRRNKNPNHDEESFRFWTRVSLEASNMAAPFFSPKLSAVSVGAITKITCIIRGGLAPRPRGDDAATPVVIDAVALPPSAPTPGESAA